MIGIIVTVCSFSAILGRRLPALSSSPAWSSSASAWPPANQKYIAQHLRDARSLSSLLLRLAPSSICGAAPRSCDSAARTDNNALSPQSPRTIFPVAKRSTHRSRKIAMGFKSNTELDSDALIRYVGAIGLQMIALSIVFGVVDIVSNLALDGGSLPWQAVSALFFLLSIRSRAFSPLDNSRPELQKVVDGNKTGGFNDRIMPSWTPPGIVFPIMWVLIVAPLRAYSSTLVWEADGGHLLDPTLLCLLLHLSIGDTWNTINNVERRLGAAVPGVACVWLSVLFAATKYSEVDAFAGQLLAITAVWITVASLLVTDTWRVNNEVASEPLYPYKSDAVRTRFWFES